MKITQTGSSAPNERSRKTGKVEQAGGGSAFRQHIESDNLPSPNAPSGTAPLTALSSLLAIQEVPDSTTGKRRAVLHGNTLLDELKALQIGLVQGWVAEDKLRSLSYMLDQPRPPIDDPELNRVLDDIELRAAVELAKFDKRTS